VQAVASRQIQSVSTVPKQWWNPATIKVFMQFAISLGLLVAALEVILIPRFDASIKHWPSD
jgi:hypothetical protein